MATIAVLSEEGKTDQQNLALPNIALVWFRLTIGVEIYVPPVLVGLGGLTLKLGKIDNQKRKKENEMHKSHTMIIVMGYKNL